jgi:hypothetical protein
MSDIVLAMRTVLERAASSARPTLADAGLLAELVEAGLAASLPLQVIRPNDLVVLEFRFVNLQRWGSKLRRRTAGQAALLVVDHPPQSFGEQAVPEIDGAQQQSYASAPDLNPYGNKTPPTPSGPPKPPPPAQSATRIAGPSRLVFEMPADEGPIDWTLEALLAACRRWPLRLASTATEDFQGFRLPPDLRLGSLAALEALDGRLSAAGIRALDTLARTLAKEALEQLAARRPVVGPTVAKQLEAGVTEALRNLRRPTARVEPKDALIDTVAAGLLVRAKAALEVAERLEKTPGFASLDASLLPIDLFPLLRKPRKPTAHVTAIEMPYRLFASPLPGAGFTHSDVAVTFGGRTELWHTRLGTRRSTRAGLTVDDRPGRPEGRDWVGEKLRFIWSPDYPDGTTDAFRKALDATDRSMLVKLTAGFNEKQTSGGSFIPRAAQLRRLMLTALGGDLEAQNQWRTRPAGVDLMGWTHRAAIGRDYSVRVEYAGFLFPFGHRATLVKITERKFEWRTAAKNDRLALLRQRFFIIVRDRVIPYAQGAPSPFAGRALPFQEIHCAVSVTPDLPPPGENPNDRLPDTFYTGQIIHRMAFWPSRGGGVDYAFPFVGIDAAGRRVSFETPALFISEIVNRTPHMVDIVHHYNVATLKDPPSKQWRRWPSLGGQTVRMAPTRADAGDVDLPVSRLEFGAHAPTTEVSSTQSTTLQQLPRMVSAGVQLVALERIARAGRTTEIEHDAAFLADGFQPGRGDLFARIKAPAPLAFDANLPSDSVGGIASPNLVPSGLSAKHGVASGNLGSFAGGNFDPKDFFPDAKLLGFFAIKELLNVVSLAAGAGAPKITSVEKLEGIETRFNLVQKVSAGQKLPGLHTGVGGDSVLTLDTQIFLPNNGGTPRNTVDGQFTNFKIDLVGCLIIRFDRLRFSKVDGRKPDVDVDLNPEHGITFGGPLEFVNTLKDLIPANGFSDPPNLSVTPAGITAGYTLGLPAVQIGVMSITNISLGAAFSLPFTGDPPTARFNFAERHNTFNLTVSMFGGGGFVAIVVGTEGVREIEAALEFGAKIAIDLGVASGSVYVKGGFYFHFATDRVEFEGYVELGGRLSVLGLISVSLTFHLSLSYESVGNKATDGKTVSRLFGQATLVVEIEILFFSASVEVTVKKTFAGSEADPKFIDLVPTPAVWSEYCAAFA